MVKIDSSNGWKARGWKKGGLNNQYVRTWEVVDIDDLLPVQISAMLASQEIWVRQHDDKVDNDNLNIRLPSEMRTLSEKR